MSNGVTLVFVNFVTFMSNCWRLTDSPHSRVINVHVIIVESSTFVNTPPSPIFWDLVFPFIWSKKELIGMFHDLLAFLEECILLSTTSMAIYNVSSIHMPILVVENNWFNYGANLLLCGLGAHGRFSLFNVGSMACKSIMLVYLLWRTMQFMIVFSSWA